MIKGLIFCSCMILSSGVFGAEAAFDIHLIPAGDFTGKTSDVKGFATVVGSKVKAENIQVSLKNLKTGIELRDNHTRKHLEADKFPEAILVKGEGENGTGFGILKIKGIEKKVTGTYKMIGNELAAQFKIKLSDFKITGIKYMGVGVDDDVTLNVKLPTKPGK